MRVGERIKQRRQELGLSQRDLADKMKYKHHSTIARVEAGAVDLSHSRIVQFADVLNVSIEYLLGIEPTSDANMHNVEKETKFDLKEEKKAFSRDIFVANLSTLMTKAGKSRKDVSAAIGVSYSTFTDWCKGKKYPRIEKLEILSDYFGITVSELVSGQNEIVQKKSGQSEKHEILDIIMRLHTDEQFLRIVEQICEMDGKKIAAFNEFISAFTK